MLDAAFADSTRVQSGDCASLGDHAFYIWHGCCQSYPLPIGRAAI